MRPPLKNVFAVRAVAPSPTAAVHVYVASTGSDTNAGTIASPKKTIARRDDVAIVDAPLSTTAPAPGALQFTRSEDAMA